MQPERSRIISISGKPGSGKSSTADKVAELLSYTRYSSGDFVRRVAKKHGLTLAEFNERAAQDHVLDHEIDEELRKLKDEKDVVIDSRLGFYWIPNSFRVYLDLDIQVATARIYSDMVENTSRSGEISDIHNIAEAQHVIEQRLKNESRRFKSMYGVDPYDRGNFDLVINTSRHSPQTVALTVFDNYKKWLKSDDWDQVISEVPMGYSFKNQY